MRITVLKNDVSTPSGKKYQVCELGYKTEEGKVKGMRIFSFGDHEEVFKVASAASKGDVLEATFRQNDKGYWEFGSLSNTGTKAATQGGATSEGVRRNTGGGNWETPEERAARQVYIVRQSSITAALAFLNHNSPKNAITVHDVIGVAKVFEDYVFDKAAKAETPTVQ